MHLVGHSLGSHIMGQTGRRVFIETNKKVARITGLDPAAPNFYLNKTDKLERRLTNDKAKFVDVIHTNTQCLGTDDLVGHVDILLDARNSATFGRLNGTFKLAPKPIGSKKFDLWRLLENFSNAYKGAKATAAETAKELKKSFYRSYLYSKKLLFL